MFNELPDEQFDNPMGESTGAAVIFGATGGVMEAALRTAVETLTGEELKNVEFQEVRGTEGIKSKHTMLQAWISTLQLHPDSAMQKKAS